MAQVSSQLQALSLRSYSPPAVKAQRQAREERLVQVGSADANAHPSDVRRPIRCSCLHCASVHCFPHLSGIARQASTAFSTACHQIQAKNSRWPEGHAWMAKPAPSLPNGRSIVKLLLKPLSAGGKVILKHPFEHRRAQLFLNVNGPKVPLALERCSSADGGGPEADLANHIATCLQAISEFVLVTDLRA